MRTLIVLLILAGMAWAQSSLPDAPSTVQKDQKVGFRKGGVWESALPGPDISWKHVFLDKRFLLPHLAGFLSGVASAEVTHAGIAHHRCREGVIGVGESRGALYANALIPMAVITGFDALVRKGKLPFYIYDGGPAYAVAKHSYDIHRWVSECW